MAVSSITSGAYFRSIGAANNSGKDRQAQPEAMSAAAMDARKAQQAALEHANQQRLAQRQQQNHLESQRGLEGRLVTYGEPRAQSSQQHQADNRAAVARERVKDAYQSSQQQVDNSQDNQDHRSVNQYNSVDYLV